MAIVWDAVWRLHYRGQLEVSNFNRLYFEGFRVFWGEGLTLWERPDIIRSYVTTRSAIYKVNNTRAEGVYNT